MHIIWQNEWTDGDSRGSAGRIWKKKNKYYFKMADEQGTQVCRHNKDKSYRSCLTHGRTRTRSLPFDLGRKRLSGKAALVLILFFFFFFFQCPCQDIGPERADRTRQQDGCCGSTLRVRFASLGGGWRKWNQSKNGGTWTLMSTSDRRLPAQACMVLLLWYCMVHTIPE